jgi:hypothetical protein
VTRRPKREKRRPAIGKLTAAREGEVEAGHREAISRLGRWHGGGQRGRRGGWPWEKKVEGKTTSRIVPWWGSCGAALTSCRFDRINQKAIDAIGSDP